MIVPVAIRPLLRQAIEERRRVGSALDDEPGGPAAVVSAEIAPAQAGPEDDEETLRRFMVVAWPAAGRTPHDENARRVFLALLARLEAPALRDDLRFLDAWNNGFEAMLTWPAEIRGRGEARAAIRTYVRILDHHARRLAGSS